MKNLLLTMSAVTVLLFSCEKGEHEKPENICPVVAVSQVPNVVKDSFGLRYPSMMVTTWFYKDSSSYCAAFSTTGLTRLAQFAPTGFFIKEITETNKEGEEEDSVLTNGKTIAGCECETH